MYDSGLRGGRVARDTDRTPCSILMRFYAALIASLLSNHCGSVVIGARGVSSSKPASRRDETAEKTLNLGEYSPGNTRTRASRDSPFGNETLTGESDTRGTEAELKYARGSRAETKRKERKK